MSINMTVDTPNLSLCIRKGDNKIVTLIQQINVTSLTKNLTKYREMGNNLEMAASRDNLKRANTRSHSWGNTVRSEKSARFKALIVKVCFNIFPKLKSM